MIVNELLGAGICFAVVQSNSYLTKAKIMHNQEYEIIALEIDGNKMARRFTTNGGFYVPESHKNPKGIISRVLELPEIQEFKSLKDEHFVKVMDNENGRIWELCDNSFKKHQKKHRNGVIGQI